jgi:hypothetical protein
LEESGMTEDELADYFDLSKPPPQPSPGAHERAVERDQDRS